MPKKRFWQNYRYGILYCGRRYVCWSCLAVFLSGEWNILEAIVCWDCFELFLLGLFWHLCFCCDFFDGVVCWEFCVAALKFLTVLRHTFWSFGINARILNCTEYTKLLKDLLEGVSGGSFITLLLMNRLNKTESGTVISRMNVIWATSCENVSSGIFER